MQFFAFFWCMHNNDTYNKNSWYNKTYWSIIWRWLFVFLLHMLYQIFALVFWKLKPQKSNSEIDWPLVCRSKAYLFGFHPIERYLLTYRKVASSSMPRTVACAVSSTPQKVKSLNSSTSWLAAPYLYPNYNFYENAFAPKKRISLH